MSRSLRQWRWWKQQSQMPKIIPSRLRAPNRRSPSARRRGSYLSLPKSRYGGSVVSGALNLGENTNLHKATALFLMLFMGLALYIGLLIPGIKDLECGVDWDSEYDAWYGGLDMSEVDQVNTAREIVNDDARLAALMSIGTGYPLCDGGAFPAEPRVLSQTLDILVPFLPLFVLIPALFLFFRQVGNIFTLPIFLFVILVREFIPGDGILDWVAITAGIIVGSLPMPMKGLLSALSHIGALALWPTMMLAYHGTVAGVSGDVAASVLTVLDFLVWIVPFGMLMLIPIRWQMRDNEALV